MKTFSSNLWVAGAVVLCSALLAGGCDKKGTPGGPGATSSSPTNSNASPSTTVTDKTEAFNLTAPSTSTTVKQGDTKTISIGIKRGKDFAQDVTLKLDGIPAGITIDPPAPVIREGDKSGVDLKVTAAADAAPGDYVIKVSGHPATGADSMTDFTIAVEKK